MSTENKAKGRVSSPAIPHYENIGGLLRYGDATVRFGVNIDILETTKSHDQRMAPPMNDECAKIFDVLQNDLGVRRFLQDLQPPMLRHHAASQQDDDYEGLAAQADPDTIIEALADTEGEELWSVVCLAELMNFSSAQRDRLYPLLWEFILTHRDGDSYNELTAVGSAIRKYIAIMDVASIGSLGNLLEPRHNAQLPLDLQIDVANLVFAKFVANPPAQPDPEPVLAGQLAQMAELYLNPRLLNGGEDAYGVVAMLALQSLAVMLSDQWNEVLSSLGGAPSWFRSQLWDHLSRIVSRWRNLQVPAASKLQELVDSINIE